MILWLVVAAMLSGSVPPCAPHPGQQKDDGAARAQAQALWDAGRRVEALDMLATVLEASPDDEELRRSLAERQLLVHRSEACLVTLTPLGPAADLLRGRALYLLGRLDEAVEALRPFADDADETIVLMLIDALESTGRAAEALDVAAVATDRLGSDHPALLAFRGRRAALAGHPDQAIDLFRAALEGDPTRLEALYGLGQALVRHGEVEQGRAVLQRHRDLVPRMDRLDFALRSIDLDPTRAGHHAQLGDALRDLGRRDDARAAYARAAELAGPDELVPVVLRQSRALAEDDRDLSAAVEVLDRAASRVADARLSVRAGDLLLDAGRAEEARERYARALALRPGDPAVRERLERAGGDAP